MSPTVDDDLARFRPEVAQQLQETRDRCRDRTAEHGTHYWLDLTEDQAIDLAAGYVPKTIRAAMLAMLDWSDDERATAQTAATQRRRARRKRA